MMGVLTGSISTIGCKHREVEIFDSLLASKEQKISVHFMDVQMQAGDSDCGLFATPFATSLWYMLLFADQQNDSSSNARSILL